jgi:hypothetical protein
VPGFPVDPAAASAVVAAAVVPFVLRDEEGFVNAANASAVAVLAVVELVVLAVVEVAAGAAVAV